MANWAVGDLKIQTAKEEEKGGWSLALVSWIQSSVFQEWSEVSALGLFGWPPFCSYQCSWHHLVPWLLFSLAGLCFSWAEGTLRFPFNHQRPPRSVLLVPQLSFSCSLDTASLCRLPDKSFCVSETLVFKCQWAYIMCHLKISLIVFTVDRWM